MSTIDLDVATIRRRLPTAGSPRLRLQAIREAQALVQSARRRLIAQRQAAAQAFHECEMAFFRMTTPPGSPPYRDRHLEARRTRYAIAGWAVTLMEGLVAVALTWWTLNLSGPWAVVVGLGTALIFTVLTKMGLAARYHDDERPEIAVRALRRLAVASSAASVLLLGAFLLTRSFDRFPDWLPIVVIALLEIAMVTAAAAFLAVSEALSRPSHLHHQYVEADRHVVEMEALERDLDQEAEHLEPVDGTADVAQERQRAGAEENAANPRPTEHFRRNPFRNRFNPLTRPPRFEALVVVGALSWFALGAPAAHAGVSVFRIVVDQSGSLLPADAIRVSDQVADGLPAIVEQLGGVGRIEVRGWDGSVASALSPSTRTVEFPMAVLTKPGEGHGEIDLFRLRADRERLERQRSWSGAFRDSCNAAAHAIRWLARNPAVSSQSRIRQMIRLSRRFRHAGGVLTLIITDGVSCPNERGPSSEERDLASPAPVLLLLVAGRGDTRDVVADLNDRALALSGEGGAIRIVTSPELSGDWSFLSEFASGATSRGPLGAAAP